MLRASASLAMCAALVAACSPSTTLDVTGAAASTDALARGVVTNTLFPGDTLTPGQMIVSADRRFTVVFQPDSNFVEYYKGRAIWASNTMNGGGEQVVFQADGNLMMVALEQGIWSTGTGGKGGLFARVHDDGTFQIIGADDEVLWSNKVGPYPAAAPVDARPSVVGQFAAPQDWPIIPIHVAVLPNGKLFSFGTNSDGLQGAQINYDLYDPATNTHVTLPNTQKTDIFCGAAGIIPTTGDVLIPGGDQRSPNVNFGIKDTLILGQGTQELTRASYLTFGRWYATLTTLPNGQQMVYGGLDDGRVSVTTPEIYDVKTDTWRSLLGAAGDEVINGGESQWWYPRNFVAPDGRVFGMSGDKMYFIDVEGTGTLTLAGGLPGTTRAYHSSAVMYAPGKILQVGGSVNGNIGGRASDGAIDVDINGGAPVVEKLSPMAWDRAWAEATVLPSGEVLVTNGSAYDNKLVDVALRAEMWSPTTKTFRPLAAAVLPRMYHSVSLLLPDGRVLTGGGGAPGPLTNLNVEMYSPPYLFDVEGNAAPRPSIFSASSHEDYGHVTTVAVVSERPIARVTLVRSGSVTHSFDMEQRFQELPFTTNGKTLDVQMPSNPNLAPPGVYMLFVLDDAGVPSVAKLLSLGVTRARDVLPSGDVLSLGDAMTSSNGRTRLLLTDAGDLELRSEGVLLWHSNTAAKGIVRAAMQVDGNFVLYTADGVGIFSSGTYDAKFAGSHLELRDDGSLALVKQGAVQWVSGSGGTSEAPIVDVARSGTATATTEAAPTEGAAAAFDDDTATRWTSTALPAALAYGLPLDEPRSVVAYALTSSLDLAAEDPAEWTIEASNDGATWAVLDARAGEAFAARGERRVFELAKAGAFSRYRLVVLSAQASAVARVAELELLGSRNLAPAGIVTGTLPCSAAEGPAQAVNGSIVGGDSDKFCSNVEGEKRLDLDLGTTRLLERFVLRHAGAGAEWIGFNTRAYAISTSVDGATFTPVVDVTHNVASMTSHKIAPTFARYVRVTSPDATLRLYELEAYAFDLVGAAHSAFAADDAAPTTR